MKHHFIFLFLLTTTAVHAQLNFKKLALNAAITEASKTGKIVLAQFESDKCTQCNEVADKGLSGPEIKEAIEQKCLPIKIDIGHVDRDKFVSVYNPTSAFGTFFISPDGELLHAYRASSTRSLEYTTQLNKALATLTEGRVTIKEIESEWNNNPSNVEAMEINLQKRAALGFPTDSLLDVYTSRLPQDSFSSIRTIKFMAMLAPNLFSRTSLNIRRNPPLFNEAWYTIPLATRIQINNRVAYKSMDIAIKEKNRTKAISVAAFHAGTHSNRDSIAALQTYNKRMLDYYVGIKDTVSMIANAVAFYDRYLVNVSLERLKLQDSLARSKALSDAPAVHEQQDGNRRVVTRTMGYAPVVQSYTRLLNEGAWLLYNYTNDLVLLKKALLWAERANQAFKSPEAMDTYARLLYKTGSKKQAIEWQTKAIALRKERNFSSAEYNAILNKMQNGESIE